MAELTGNAVTRTPLTALPSRRLALLAVIATGFFAVSSVLPPGTASIAFLAASGTVALLFLSLGLARHVFALRDRAAVSAISTFIADDRTCCIVTDGDGIVLSRNKAAEKRFGQLRQAGLSSMMSEVFANPSGMLRQMRQAVQATGAAQEDVVTRNGQGQLSVQGLPDGTMLWRFHEYGTQTGFDGGRAKPVLTVGRSNSILFMNSAARALVGQRPKTLQSLFDSLPLRPGDIHELRTKDGPRNVRVIELGEAGGRREIMLLEVGADDAQGTLKDDLAEQFEIMPVPILRLDKDGAILAANGPARDMLGPDCQPGASISDLMEGLGRSIKDWLAEAAKGSKPVNSEFLRLSAPDSEAYIQVTLKPMQLNGQDTLIAVMSDATELKTLEAQFVQSQKMQAIGQLAGGVAHDFNNLLTAISGHCDLLLLRHDAGDPDYSDLMQINQNANRAASLVGQLLAFSRKQTLRPQPLDLRDTLSDLTHLLNRLVGEKVTLTLSHDPLLRPIRADKRQLEQVIMNLVVNARDAMTDRGEIRIITETLRLTEPLRRDRAEVSPGEYVSVKVIDTGRGISADKLSKVFEPFFTTKRVGEGTGLGLSTAYGIVKQTGGFIFADSEPGKGTCFTLMFPVYIPSDSDMDAAAVHQLSAATRAEAKPSRVAEGVVLLVEDEAPVRAFASQALRMSGYTVLEAESAESALKTLMDDDLKIDIFVTDVVMPGMDGPSWVRKALEKRPGVRVVFVSGYAEENFGDAQSRIPNSVFLPKPFSLTQLTDTVQRQLH